MQNSHWITWKITLKPQMCPLRTSGNSPLCPTGHRPFGAAAVLSFHYLTWSLWAGHRVPLTMCDPWMTSLLVLPAICLYINFFFSFDGRKCVFALTSPLSMMRLISKRQTKAIIWHRKSDAFCRGQAILYIALVCWFLGPSVSDIVKLQPLRLFSRLFCIVIL